MQLHCSFCDSPDPAWIGTRQLANLLGMTEQHTRERCRRGLIPGAEKVLGMGAKGFWRVPKAEAVRYVLEQKGLL